MLEQAGDDGRYRLLVAAILAAGADGARGAWRVAARDGWTLGPGDDEHYCPAHDPRALPDPERRPGVDPDFDD